MFPHMFVPPPLSPFLPLTIFQPTLPPSPSHPHLLSHANQTDNLDPALDRDPNPHPTFSFWKTGALQFRDPKDCWEQCQACLQKGIDAGRAVKTQCNYQADKMQLGSTCEMGFDYDTPEDLAKMQPGGLNNLDDVSMGQWVPYLGWKGTISSSGGILFR